MPQIRIEFSGNLDGSFDASELAPQVHAHLTSIAGADLSSCKTRFVRLDDVFIADGYGDQGMVHVDIGILSGRSDEQKRALGAAVMESLRGAVQKPADLNVQLTVEVRDMDRQFYNKAWLTR